MVVYMVSPLTQLLFSESTTFKKKPSKAVGLTESRLWECWSPLRLSVHVSSLGPERLQEAGNGPADQSGRVCQACHRRLQAEESTS